MRRKVSGRATRRLGAAFVACALASGAGVAAAAPEPAVRRVHVLHVAASRPYPYEAIKLTKAIEAQIAKTPSVRLINSNLALLEALDAAKCAPRFVERAFGRGSPLDAEAGQLVEPSCLKKVAGALGPPPSERFLWGWLYDAGGGAVGVTLGLWQRDGTLRQSSLRYDPDAPDEVAERLVLRLLEAERAGEVRLVTSPGVTLEGELFVDGEPKGRFGPQRNERTLLAGEHRFEVRQGGEVRAQGRGQVYAGSTQSVLLEGPAPEPPRAAYVPPPPPPPTPPPPPPRAQTLPWVLSGIGLAGFVGAGAFFALWAGQQGDLSDACSGAKRCFDEQDTIYRSKLYSTLAIVSLGVGAGAGAGAYVAWRSSSSDRAPAGVGRGPAVWAGVEPLGGGAAALVKGRF
ncbi:MAG TPA: hypothetical protein VFS43_17325 [Polyangiaceae bacterium]|nr:hypothetical protein [Polyangiaceae bacterium]